MTINVKELTIEKAHASLKSGEYTVTDLVNTYCEIIKEKNPDMNAYLEVYDDILAQAKIAEEMFANGSATLMTGIPLAIKGVFLIEGKRVSGASKILENYISTYDATVIKKLKEQGAIFLGEANLDEFAMGGSTENSGFGVTRNPYDRNRVAGGSSGGSVAAVAAHMALGSLGSDTGGSVREPAAFCNIVGFKPTYGKISRYGLMAMGSSLDCVGQMARTVADTEIMYRAIAGYDPLDSTSLPENPNQLFDKKSTLTSTFTIGVPWSLVNQDGVDVSVKENFMQAVEKLKQRGHEIKDVSLPNIGLALAIYYIIMPAEASSNLARYDGIRYGLSVETDKLFDTYAKTRGKGFGKEVRRRILLGTYVLSHGYYDAYYGKAQSARKVLTEEFASAFREFDLILTPTTPIPAWKIGEKSDPLSVYLADIFTVTANIVGLPAISVPSGFITVEEKELPLGIQFLAPHGREDILFAIGKDFEKLVQ